METAEKLQKGEKISLIQLFEQNDYTVEIPIIQRDYAQGRDSKLKIRTRFIDVLYQSLAEDKKIDLDFVYGTLSHTGGNKKFIPLDGQQRLTTLFLLHYYLALKDDEYEHFRSIFSRKNKSAFTYKTRDSSRFFCDALATEGFIELNSLLFGDAEKQNQFSETVKDSKWYFRFWNNDSTIKGMLKMLDTIHYKFKETEGLYAKLTDTVQPLVTFEFLNLETYKLTDDLYIKMNARGKALSPFENFKAQFEKLLDSKNPQYRNEFSKNVDGVWCDLFWNYSVADGHYTIDHYILNFFNYISEMLFYRSAEKYEGLSYSFDDFSVIEAVYSDQHNIEFLIFSLNLFAGSRSQDRKAVDAFFSDIFDTEKSVSAVGLFDPAYNLFEKAIAGKSSFDNKDKLILYTLIYRHFQLKCGSLEVSENLKDLTRIIRNLVFSINQRGNGSQKDQVSSDLRTSDYEDVIAFTESLADEDVLKNLKTATLNMSFKKEFMVSENRKTDYILKNPHKKELIIKLENHRYLRGDLRAFEKIIAADRIFDFTVSAFYSIWNESDTKKIIQSLIGFGHRGAHVGNCYFGGLWFFGNTERWQRIFWDTSNELADLLDNYFEELALVQGTFSQRLDHIIQTKALDWDRNSWQYLCLKYNRLLSSTTQIYSFRDYSYYTIDRIDGHSLRGWHINIFIDEVLQNEKLKVKIKNNGWASDTNESFIQLRHSAFMMPENEGWYIDSKSQNIDWLMSKYGHKILSENKYLLVPNKDFDFIEVAVDFLNNYYQKES